MSNILKPVEELAAGAQQYASKAMILARVKLTVMLAETATVLIGSLWSLTLLVFFMFTTSVGLSLYFGELFGNAAVGFFVMAGIYLVLFFVVRLFFYSGIKARIQNRIIQKLMKE